jgi:hypothetical protein
VFFQKVPTTTHDWSEKQETPVSVTFGFLLAPFGMVTYDAVHFPDASSRRTPVLRTPTQNPGDAQEMALGVRSGSPATTPVGLGAKRADHFP